MTELIVAELDRARRVVPALPRLVREGGLRARFVSELRVPIAALAVVVVAGVWLVPPVAGAVADLLFPAEEVTRGRFFSRTRTVDNPFRDPFALALVISGWMAGGLGVLSLLTRAAERALGSSEAGPSEVGATLISGARTLASGARSVLETALGGGARETGSGGAVDAGARYSIRGELGRGAMGIVHLAEDTVLGREVALKELPPHLVRSEELSERFRIEARALAKLSHPGIVQVYDLVSGPSGTFMAMELVRGGSLDERLVEGEPMPVAEVARVGALMAEALEHAHSAGVVHRDFKPQNVLMTEAGVPKVTDFGLAKMQEGPKLTQAGAMMGSPAYMSPEQATGGPADGKTDVYALGVTLFQMTTGRLPFEESGPALFMAHLSNEPPSIDSLVSTAPRALVDVVGAMLAKAPADRPAMAEVAAILASLEPEVSGAAAP